jgi:energy-coupling factor transporter ATP-binding protein EcfA2
MPRDATITSIRFRNFKAFRAYSVALRRTNILVGPNNCGKSTILGACRVLSAAIRHARSRSPEWVSLAGRDVVGYHLSPDVIPISLENVHTDYNEEGSTVDFRVSNGNQLRLHFTTDRECYLLPETERRVFRPTDFRHEFPLTIGVVPVLGPLENNEPIVEPESVTRALQTHRACRHFRNYWHFFPEGFAEFADLVKRTWPGMAVQAPEQTDKMARVLHMFCVEGRMPRELYWAGFGFQVWCQLLTHIARSKDDALLIIDEPEIYLHPDVQRQLLSLLRDIGPDIVIATHSTEMMTEADPSDILIVDKERMSAKRLHDVAGVQEALESVGSIQNITLTRLARNKRVLFVEGASDFVIVRRFARRVGLEQLAAGADITAVESEGFSSWERIGALSWGFQKALGRGLIMGAIFDRDFWCEEEIAVILGDLRKTLAFAHIHGRKEMENYLLVPCVLDRAIQHAVEDRIRRGGQLREKIEPATALLDRLTDPMKAELQGQYVARRVGFLKGRGVDEATISTATLRVFETKWTSLATRMQIVDGGSVLRLLREEVHRRWKVNITDNCIVDQFRPADVPDDLTALLNNLETFRRLTDEG